MYNLLFNAIKFTPPGNAVQVSLASARQNGVEFIRLDVKDTGIGIEQEQLEQIFDRFYQGTTPRPAPRAVPASLVPGQRTGGTAGRRDPGIERGGQGHHL
ncbi:MAG: hypothetical protein H6573_15465 [Lewinellaceae bacterium]|nr:hypothetical protein [Lewinellaceae bacterium]